jgi:hypothetical protein
VSGGWEVFKVGIQTAVFGIDFEILREEAVAACSGVL